MIIYCFTLFSTVQQVCCMPLTKSPNISHYVWLSLNSRLLFDASSHFHSRATVDSMPVVMLIPFWTGVQKKE